MTTTDQALTVQDRIDRYWSDRAASYDDHQRRPDRLPLNDAAWEDVWAEALPPAPATVLDVGTGSGYVAFRLAALGHDVTATDRAAGMLERARQHAGDGTRVPRFRHGDAVAPDFNDGAFDAVVNRYVMWTLRDPVTALANWRRLLRPGGTLALVDSTWFPDGLDADTTDDFVRWYDDEVRSALPLAPSRSIGDTADVVAAAGFRGVTVTPLTRILELDREYGAAPGHEVRLQFLVRASA
ncbi:methyltransferase domain-containing protein [Nocardioides panacisoli]|uniref:class I SAM-dependent methyltransferase n=1 Tax=Nocardioides panacisoli TaxID=627624 RepID=UPI001C62A49F|nr:class I SAM-dependent methyltransferase [Nocardioides panacisoli]QYJ04303.1 methyltransferase domain-containing protein [Nocardioides panacisoli]